MYLQVPWDSARCPCVQMPSARFPSLTPPPTLTTPEVLSKAIVWKDSRSMTVSCQLLPLSSSHTRSNPPILPSFPPELKLAYECPPDFAWTFTPTFPAHTTASCTCFSVVGSTITAGLYGNRRLYGCASWAYAASLATLYGTFFPLRHWAAEFGDGVGVGVVWELLAVLDAAPLLVPQFPNPAWHPVPQYAVVDPHHPALLQQFPNALLRQVWPFDPPQVASLEMVAARAVPEKRPAARRERAFMG